MGAWLGLGGLRVLSLAHWAWQTLLPEKAFPCPPACSILDHVVLLRLPDRCAPLPAAQGPPELILMAEGTWRD